jgi:sugar phosphate isomerase/epimerase
MNATEQNRVIEVEKLGFGLAGFRQWPLDKSLGTLAEIGYTAVELCLEHPGLDLTTLTPAALSKLKTRLKKLGLRVSSVSCHSKLDGVFKSLKKQKLAIEFAGEFGAHVLVVGTAASTLDPQGSDTTRALEELVRAAEGTGVVVAVEPEPDTVIHGMYEFSMLASHLSGSSLGLNLDLGHAFLTEGSATSVVDEWAPFIVQVHIEDVIKPDHLHLLPGDGHVDLTRALEHLRENGYSGNLIVDHPDGLDDPKEWARLAMERCRDLLK